MQSPVAALGKAITPIISQNPFSVAYAIAAEYSNFPKTFPIASGDRHTEDSTVW